MGRSPFRSTTAAPTYARRARPRNSSASRSCRPTCSATRSAPRSSPPGARIETSVGVMRAAQAAVAAAEVALAGVREEAKVGQRTTLDVLNAQQTLLNARVQLVSPARQRRQFLQPAVGDRPAVDRDARARRRRNTTRASISTRSRTSCWACARRTEGEHASVAAQCAPCAHAVLVLLAGVRPLRFAARRQ